MTSARESLADGESDKAFVTSTAAIETARRLSDPDLRATIEPFGDLLLLLARAPQLEQLLLDMLGRSIALHGANSAPTLDRLRLIARFYFRTADFGEAERYGLRALATARQLHGLDHEQTIASTGELARTMLEAQRPVEAAPFVQQHLERAERILGEGHAETRRALLNLAALRLIEGKSDEAVTIYRRLVESLASSPLANKAEMVEPASRLAHELALGGKSEEAAALMRRIEPAIAALPERDPERLMVAYVRAILMAQSGDVKGAEKILYEAAMSDPRGPDHPDVMGATALIAGLRLGDPDLAGSAFEMADRAISGFISRSSRAYQLARKRTSGFADAEQRREAETRSRYYALLADTAWFAFNQPEADFARDHPGATQTDMAGYGFDAIQAMEANPAGRAMINMAARRAADGRSAGLGELVRERQQLDEAFALARSDQLQAFGAEGGAAAAAAPARAAEERDRIEARIGKIDEQLRRDFPQYFYLSMPGQTTVYEAVEMLAEDEAILMVAPGAGGTDILVAVKGGLMWRRSEWTETEVSAATRRLLWHVGATVQATPQELFAWQSGPDASAGFDRKTAHALYRQIVEPVAGALQGKKHLFVYTSGILSSLPFGMLVTAEPQGADEDPRALRETKWMADAFAISHIPSIQALYLLRQAAGTANRRQDGRAAGTAFVGFGDPLLTGQARIRGRSRGGAGVTVPPSLFTGLRTRAGTPLADVALLRRMNRLPGTAAELEAMRLAFNAPPEAVRLRERATETEIRSANLKDARIIAFATHGLVAGEVINGAEPGLVLTPPATASEQDDGLLTASEVASLSLDADWVILSACNTAAGDSSRSVPGLSQLTRAFFFAGARALLASHWPVGDDVAAKLTVRTIELQRNNKGMSRAEAFRLAMAEIRNDPSHDRAGETWAHPAAWAPFTLFGDGARTD